MKTRFKKICEALTWGLGAGLIILILNFSTSVLLHGQLPAPIGLWFWPYVSTANTFTNTGTVSAQQLTGVLTDTNTGAAALTTDTATNICALFPAAGNTGGGNSAYIFWLKNSASSSGAVTLTAGTGVTITGTATVAAGSIKPFIGVMACPPGTTAAVNYVSLGTSVF